MATRGQQELTKCERKAREAIDAMQNDQLWKLGDYNTTYAGASIRATIASEFCSKNDIQQGDTLAAFMHSATGALVLIPARDPSDEED